MNCRNVVRMLSAYVDRELTGDETLAVRDHLCECAECSLEHEKLKHLKAMLAKARTVDPEPGVYARLKERVHGPVVVSSAQKSRGVGIAVMAACASALGMALLVAHLEQDKGLAPGGTPSMTAESVPGDSLTTEGLYRQAFQVKY